MTEETLRDLCLCGETTKVQFKEKFTSQKEIAKEMVAFANKNGGVLLFGVKDKTGEPIGLSYEQIQTISSELGNAANEQVKPTVYIGTEVVKLDGKHILVCSVEEGRNKPYKNLQGEIWVKQGADKRRITENSEILGLFQASGNYHPEEDAEKGTSIADLEMAYVREFFKKVYGRDIEEFDQPLESMLHSLGIMKASGELTRAGMLFFGKHPQQFERSVVVKAVAFAGDDIADTNYLDSRDITGTLPWMFKEGMSFLKSYLRHSQNGQNFNSVGILEIPEVVLEELLQNALVHFDLLNHAAIRILIFDDRVEIINPGCLYGGLNIEDIKLGVSRQRNPLMADLAAKTMIYRGLGSGIVRAIRENCQIRFVNEEVSNQFKAIVRRTALSRPYTIYTTHDVAREGESLIQKKRHVPKEGTTTPKEEDFVQKNEITTQKDKFTTQKNENLVQKNEITTQKDNFTTQKNENLVQKNEITTQKRILNYFRNNPRATRVDAANALGDISEDGVKFIISKLRQKGLLKRVGGRKFGEWQVIE